MDGCRASSYGKIKVGRRGQGGNAIVARLLALRPFARKDNDSVTIYGALPACAKPALPRADVLASLFQDATLGATKRFFTEGNEENKDY
jgi:hypothetical protein